MGKKEKKAIWIADEYAPNNEGMNRHELLHMLHTRKVAKPKKAKPKKAKRIYKELMAQQAAELFTHTPDPERPVQFVGPRSLAVRPAPNKHMEVQGATTGNVAEFGKMLDGGLHVGVSNGSWGGQFADINLNPEQFAAFKQWIMEN